MLTTIRRLGNSQGILIPKPLLRQVGLEDQAELTVDGDSLVLRRPKSEPRAGWSEAAKLIASEKEDHLVMGEFTNEEDTELV